jgi:hypothetical protein
MFTKHIQKCLNEWFLGESVCAVAHPRPKQSILRSYIKWRFYIVSALLIKAKQQHGKNQNKNTDLFINFMDFRMLEPWVHHMQSHSYSYSGNIDIDHPVGLYPIVVKQNSGREVPVVLSCAFTKYLGQLRLKV